jgi:hypothetical protein
MKNKFAKWKPYIFLAVLLASLVPLVWLGRYNYPTGDDYYYGTEAHLVWQQTGSIPQAISAACAGVAKSYQIWQGTYSALFLMYLAPNAFSNTAYHLVTFVILLLLCASFSLQVSSPDSSYREHSSRFSPHASNRKYKPYQN